MNEDQTAEEIVELNIEEYQKHQAIVDRLTKSLQNQNNIRTFQTIPKCYRPPATLDIIVPNPDLSEEFSTRYQRLFFQHLTKVITHNTVSLELEQARLRDIKTRTLQQIQAGNTDEENVSLLKKKFLTAINSQEEHLTTPITPATTAASTNTPSTSSKPSPKKPSKKNRKRQILTHPQTIKSRKLEHFLSKGQDHKPPS